MANWTGGELDWGELKGASCIVTELDWWRTGLPPWAESEFPIEWEFPRPQTGLNWNDSWWPEAMLLLDAILKQKMCLCVLSKISGRRRQCYTRTQGVFVCVVLFFVSNVCYLSKYRTAGGNAITGRNSSHESVCCKCRAGRNALNALFVHVGPLEAMPWHAMACHGMPWYARAWHGMPWHAMQCHGMPRNHSESGRTSA